MNRLPLTTQIDSIEFSDASIELFQLLAQFSATDEFGAVILAAAARLLANEHPAHTRQDVAALKALTAEFHDLVFEMRPRSAPPAPTHLTLVDPVASVPVITLV